jgi:BlaI family penicillinase repressor
VSGKNVTARVSTVEAVMAKKKGAVKLSVGEMRLMAVLWKFGPLKLSEVHREQPGQVGYTTIQTQLNRLVEKGVVARSSTRPTKYKAIIDSDDASSGMLQLLIDTIGGGSIFPVVEQLVRRSPLTKDEVRELKKRIDRATAKPARKKKVVKTPKVKAAKG